MEKAFFDGTSTLLRTAVVGVLAYFILIFILRVSGKRTLSKLNAFDLVVTVALGSTLSSILLSTDVTLAQGALAFVVLIGLQFSITWSSVRLPWVRRLVTGEPTLLLYRGEFLRSAMRKMRVTEDEIRAEVRSAGLAHMDETEAVVLETDGSMTVVEEGTGGRASSLEGVERPPGTRER